MTTSTSTTSLRKVTIAAYGSRGDIQPYVAIGYLLKKAGYEVRVITSPSGTHESLVKDFGMIHVPWGQDVEKEIMENDQLRKAMTEGDTALFFKMIGESSKEVAPSVARGFVEEIQNHPPDLVIAGSLCDYFGLYTAYHCKIPTIAVLLNNIQFCYDPNRAPFGLPTLPMQLHYYIIKYLIAAQIYSSWHTFDQHVSHFTGHSALLDQILPKSQFLNSLGSPTAPLLLPTIMCQSSLYKDILFPNIPPQVRFVGAATLTKESQRTQSPSAFGTRDVCRDIAAFLQGNKDKPPVYMGWGSMLSKSPEHMTLLAVKALQASNQRGIILSGWGGLGMEALKNALTAYEKDTNNGDASAVLGYAKDNVLFVEKAPHEWLFPQVACTVHHGGAGTLAVALRAGVPTVVTPVFVDQYDNAFIVEKLGVGVGFSKQLQKIQHLELAKAIQKAVETPEIIAASKKIGDAIRQEDGASAVVEEVQKFWKNQVQTGSFLSEIEVARVGAVTWKRHDKAKRRKIIWAVAAAWAMVMAVFARGFF